jgi:hypothetical protein
VPGKRQGNVKNFNRSSWRSPERDELDIDGKHRRAGKFVLTLASNKRLSNNWMESNKLIGSILFWCLIVGFLTWWFPYFV